jgi:hypothetical protein
MSNHSRFVIRNDLAVPLIVNIEPECLQIPLAPGEKVTVQEMFEREPITLKVDSDKGDTIISLWPGDGEMLVEKEGVDVFELVEKAIGNDGLAPNAPTVDNQKTQQAGLARK